MSSITTTTRQVVTATAVNFWLLQPLLMYLFMVKGGKGKSSMGAVTSLSIFVALSTLLAVERQVLPNPPSDAVAMSLWGLSILFLTKYTSAIALALAGGRRGGELYATKFGWNSFGQVVMANIATPLLIFTNNNNKNGHVSPSKHQDNDIHNSLVSGLLYKTITEFLLPGTFLWATISFSVVHGPDLPIWVERWLYLYCGACFEQIVSYHHEACLRILLSVLQYDDNHVTIVAHTYHPYLATSPRELWKRRSCSIAYQLRTCIYEPMIQDGYSRQVATLVVFAANGAVHSLFCYWLHGEWMLYECGYMMIGYPMLSIGIQGHVLGPRGYLGLSKTSSLYRVANYLVMIVPMMVLLPYFARMMLLPPTLNGFATNIHSLLFQET